MTMNQGALQRRFAALLFLLALAVPFQLQAQCPSPPACVPGDAQDNNASVFGTGIFQVELPGINRSFSGATAGYQDLSCTDTFSALSGIPHSYRIENGDNIAENLRIWVDFNQDGQFQTPAETLVSSNDRQIHQGTFSFQASQVSGSNYLRMRVASEAVTNPAPTPCDTPQLGHYQDYGLRIVENTQPPQANFEAEDTVLCNGQVQFHDLSTNGPTSWFWEFGDGNTSTQANPLHFYPFRGTFDVRLVVENPNGKDTLTRTQYIDYTRRKPQDATCTPNTQNFCCGYGIGSVKFGDLSSSSANASEGYQDFSCTRQAQLREGTRIPYDIQTTGDIAHDIRAWLDTNNNGSFEASEKIIEALNTQRAQGTWLIPFTGPIDEPLRLRITADAAGNTAGPCTNPVNGQTEDYGVVIQPANARPKARIAFENSSKCSPNYQFIDSSLGAPKAWHWDFGDGDTSLLQNPQHTYQSFGNYDVRLVVENRVGKDTAFLRDEASFVDQLASSCFVSTSSPNSVSGILQVRLNEIEFSSGPSKEGGYQDRTCQEATPLRLGEEYEIQVRTGAETPEFVRVWIDYNNNTVFEDKELVFDAPADTNMHLGKVFVNPEDADLQTSLRMRVASENISRGKPSPCDDREFGQVEDYTVFLLPNNQKPQARFASPDTSSCTGLVRFRQSSLHSPDSLHWAFGDGSTSEEQAPAHQYEQAGQYTVSLVACNAFGCDTLEQAPFIDVEAITRMAPAACRPSSKDRCCGIGFDSLRVAGLQRDYDVARPNYADSTCNWLGEIAPDGRFQARIRTSSSQEQVVGLWLDYNNDGNFSAEEKAFETENQGLHQASFQVPETVDTGQAIRARLITDLGAIELGGPCAETELGQAIDFGFWVRENRRKPEVDFSVEAQSPCSAVVRFREQSLNAPDSFRWDFGDGSTSAERHPQHTYQQAGNYTVQLIACNDSLCDTLSKTNLVQIDSIPGPLPPHCAHPTAQATSGSGILRFQLNQQSFPSADAATDGGYLDRACDTRIPVNAGVPLSYEVRTGQNFTEDLFIAVDLNRDGVFSTAEFLLESRGKILHSGTFSLPDTLEEDQLYRLRVISLQNGPDSLPCGTALLNGQAEDYGIRVMDVVSVNRALEGRPKEAWKLYPNPTEGAITLEWQGKGTNPAQQIEVLSIEGRLLRQYPAPSGQRSHFNLQTLPAGSYLLRLRTPAGPVHRLIEKQ